MELDPTCAEWAERAFGPRTFPVVLENLHRSKHTGAVVIHFQSGQPRAVEIMQSTRIALDNIAAPGV